MRIINQQLFYFHWFISPKSSNVYFKVHVYIYVILIKSSTCSMTETFVWDNCVAINWSQDCRRFAWFVLPYLTVCRVSVSNCRRNYPRVISWWSGRLRSDFRPWNHICGDFDEVPTRTLEYVPRGLWSKWPRSDFVITCESKSVQRLHSKLRAES